MNKRFVLILIASVLACSVLWGGGSREDSDRLMASRWAGPHADYQKQIVRDYPTANVIIDDIDYGNLQQRQITSLQSSQGRGSYDVVWVNIKWMKNYVDAGYLMELDDMIADSGLDTSMYAEGMLDGCQYDGKTYGLPTFAQGLMLVYDKEAFERHDLAVPQNAQELIEVARFFKEAEGTGIALPARQGGASVTLYSHLMFADGGYYFDEDGQLDLLSKESVNAAKTYEQLVGYSVDGTTAWHHDEVAEAVRTKIAPIGTVMSGLANQNHDPERSMIVDTVGYAPITGNEGTVGGNNAFWVWAVAKNSSNAEEAFNFISWLTSPEIEKKQTIENQQISAISSLSEDPEVLEVTPFLPVVMEQLAAGKVEPLTRNFSQLEDELIVGLSEIATTDADPVQVLSRIQDKLKDVDFSQ